MKFVNGELDIIACLTILSFILSLYFLYNSFHEKKNTEKTMMMLYYLVKEVHELKA